MAFDTQFFFFFFFFLYIYIYYPTLILLFMNNVIYILHNCAVIVVVVFWADVSYCDKQTQTTETSEYVAGNFSFTLIKRYFFKCYYGNGNVNFFKENMKV